MGNIMCILTFSFMKKSPKIVLSNLNFVTLVEFFLYGPREKFFPVLFHTMYALYTR